MTVRRKGFSPKTPHSPTILDLLGEKAEWRSGEEMAEILGVSRVAIAKQIGVLRKKGHVIESMTRLGHRLLIRYEEIDSVSARSHLRTKVLGQAEWRILGETESTNNEAIAWALAGASAGSIVTAERQTLGKGRKKNDWFSSPHALQFSIILRPRGGEVRESDLALLALEAVSETITAACGSAAKIKLPNDLLLGGRKICGVLLESGKRAGFPDWIALGIGCNINVVEHDFPKNIRDKATSLFMATGTAFSRNSILAHILNSLEDRL